MAHLKFNLMWTPRYNKSIQKCNYELMGLYSWIGGQSNVVYPQF